ncbi:divalent-cation tolerance protein CutA [Micromonospora inositola]|nr:divalent-cation tolerance protein CutA [Micromonospora inositola]
MPVIAGNPAYLQWVLEETAEPAQQQPADASAV